MATKNYKTRVQHKTDTSANWALATTFTPLKGEVCFYSDLNKIKIGDGQTLLSELPFFGAEIYEGLADKIDKNMDVLATGLAAGESPTVQYNSSTNALSFGIPKGDKGDTGNTGAQGPAGANGSNGADGATWYFGDDPNYQTLSKKTGDFFLCTARSPGGNAWDVLSYGSSGWTLIGNIKGANGTNGTNGTNGYTPVRGTDYWTAADINVIKSYVDDAILNGAW